MPAQGSLAGTVIDTGNVFQDSIDNVHQLILEHLGDLKVQGKNLIANSVTKYDDIKIYNTPAISIVFETANVIDMKINNCATMAVNLVLYYYFQSLSYGVDTHPFVGALYKLNELFLVHWDLYGYTKGTSRNLEITESSLVGRRLDSDAFLTGQLSLTVNRRICTNGHS